MSGLAGKVAVVTGGADGLGAASALRLSRKGCQVVVVDVDEDGARKVAESLPAEKGTLTIMVGGSVAAFESVRWVFGPIAAKVVLMGASGAGHSTKLLNNFLNAVTLAATAEVMVAAKKADLDLAAVLDVVNSSSGVSFASTNRFPHIIKGDYLEGGLTSNLMTKDVVAYVDHVRELGVPCLMMPAGVVGFVGLGNMGLPMTQRLVAAGYQVRGYDMSADAVTACAACWPRGCGWAATPTRTCSPTGRRSSGRLPP